MKKAPPPPPAVAVKPPPPLSNGTDQRNGGQQRPPPLTPGEDCAIDELVEGRMELQVVLPDLKVVKMTVDRRTPMMDLLVQATTANKITPGGHIINVVSKDERNVNYKPNTSIGSLDVNIVYIVPKSTIDLPVKRMPKLANQPFEQTFRLQVNLPRNQRMVLRVSPRITLAELKNQICFEKELDHSCHHLVHPSRPDTVLDLNATLEVYGCAEISLMSSSGLRDSIRSTSTNLFAYPKIVDEEKQKKKGILRLFSRKKRDFPVQTPANGIPLSRSESSNLNRNSLQSKQSLKRKPAPAPPPITRNSPPLLITQSSSSVNSRPESEISGKTDEIESTISHSRHSSDSSGYHEPSIFSDCSENKSPEASIVHGGDHVVLSRQESPLHNSKDSPDSGVLLKRSSMTAKDSSNLKNVPSCSNVSIVSASRKRKAPLPPAAPTLPSIESPTSPEIVPIGDDIPNNGPIADCLPDDGPIRDGVIDDMLVGDGVCDDGPIGDGIPDYVPIRHISEDNQSEEGTGQKESEALQYLEDVLQQSEVTESLKSFAGHRTMDDSDTDSQKDEEEVISVCQAEVHANDNDHDVSRSMENLHALATPGLTTPKSPALLPANPILEVPVNEAIDNPAEHDSGISTSLNSDADSSLPSITSDFKSAFDCEYHEELYCNVTGSDIQPVPSNEPLIQSNSFKDTDELEGNESFQKGADIQEKEDMKTSVLAECNDSPPTSEASAELDESEVTLNPAPGASPSASHESNSPVLELVQEQCTEPNSLDQITHQPNVDQDISPELEKLSKIPVVIAEKDSMQQRSTKSSVSSGSLQNSADATPQSKRKLTNFALGCYKSETNDIYSLPKPMDEYCSQKSDIAKQESVPLKAEPQPPMRRNKEFPSVKIVPFKARNEKDDIEQILQGSDSVLEKCAHLSNVSTLPLTGRSSSLYNLTPQKKTLSIAVQQDSTAEDGTGMKRTQSDQNLTNGVSNLQQREEFLQEQKRLQEEYQRLQEEFISWQKQLLSNQNLLQSEQIVPQMPFPSFEDIQSKIGSLSSNSSQQDGESAKTVAKQADQVELRTRSLPRPKTKQLTLKSPDRPETPPIPSPDVETGETSKRPESLTSCSVNTQANVSHQEDKVTQAPSPPEKATSGTQVPSPDSENVALPTVPETCDAKTQKPSPDSDSSSGSKSQTLPRPKPKPTSALPPSQTMTLNRTSRQKPQVVSVTIGSWQQRGNQTAITDIEPSSVALSRSKFQSLGNIPLTFSKPAPVPSSMEHRKLPPVPSDESSQDSSDQKCSNSKPGSDKGAIPKNLVDDTTVKVATNTANKEVSSEKVVPHIDKTSKTTISRQAEVAAQKQKLERISTSKDGNPSTKPGKAIVRLSSMKDDRELPIKGLRKWPLSDINETSEVVRHTVLEDLRASSKKPGGYVQEKIRRAEVDLRKPKSSKVELTTSPKAKETTERVEKLHITKVDINGPKTDDEPHHHASKNVNRISLKATTPVTVSSSTEKWNNTIPKSKSLNTELMSVFSKKPENKRASISTKEDVKTNCTRQSITVNGSSAQPPPPPPPPMPSTSAMPTIPPAEQIPNSSRLLMAGEAKTLAAKKESKKSPSKFSRSKDPREELMLEIRGFGGKLALRKAPKAQANWHLKVFGTSSTANS